jgi:ATP-dependent DNA helicase RecG
LVRKVIELERQKGFTDRAVVGGLEAMVRRQLPEVASIVAGYSKMSEEERAEALKRLEEKMEKILHKNEKLRLDTPIRYAPGVGEKREALFQKLGIHTIEDLLTFFPKRLEDRTQLRPIKDLQDGENALVEGVLRAKSKVKVKPNLELVKAALDDGTSILFGVWFNQPWMWDQLEQGQRYAFYGKVQIRFGEIQMENPIWEKAGAKEQTGRFVPIYPSTEGLSQNVLQSVIRRTLVRMGSRIPEVLPEETRKTPRPPPQANSFPENSFPRKP